MKTTSHNHNSKSDKSYFGEADELITVHKSSIYWAVLSGTQIAKSANTDPALMAYSAANRALEIEKQNFGDNKQE